MTHPEVCVGAIVVIDGKILLIKRGTEPELGKWSIPGGRVITGESLETAVKRELYEETGLKGECKSFVGWAEIITDISHKVILDFEIAIKEETEPVPATDAIDSRWIPLSTLEHFDMAEGLKAFLYKNGYIETK
jgi:ADP-ribose pyrophosphatase